MKIEQEIVTLIAVDHKEGVGKKSGKPYSFDSIRFADDDLNRFQGNLGRDVFPDNVIPDWVFDAAEEKAKVVIDFEIIPKDFDCSIRIKGIEPKE